MIDGTIIHWEVPSILKELIYNFSSYQLNKLALLTRLSKLKELCLLDNPLTSLNLSIGMSSLEEFLISSQLIFTGEFHQM